MFKRKQRNLKPIKTYAIVGDGYSEKIYFEKLRAFEKLQGLTIKPELPHKSGKGGTYVRVFNKAEALVNQGYDGVYCLIDLDTVYAENNYDAYLKRRTALEKKGVTVLESNPCFEMWLLLHFEFTAKLFENCKSVERFICQHTPLNDYHKSRDYHNQKNLYATLKPMLATNAIPNAKRLELNEKQEASTRLPRCHIFKVFCDFHLCNCTEKTACSKQHI